MKKLSLRAVVFTWLLAGCGAAWTAAARAEAAVETDAAAQIGRAHV